jgi:hypothetical protein
MSLKLQIDSAKNAVSKALITALQDKNETAVTDLFDAYNKLVSTQITETNKTVFTVGGNIPTSYYGSSMGDDVISFGAVGRP